MAIFKIMIVINRSKFIEISDEGLSFYDGNHQKIVRYNKQIWLKIIEWYQIPRELEEIPQDILPMNEMIALKKVLLKLNVLKEDKAILKSFERLNNFYDCYGGKSLEEISKIKVMIWGCGTVGTAIVDNLAKMGVKNFLLIDSDIVEEKNIIAQSIYQKEDIGLKKVRVIKNYVEMLNIGEFNIEISDNFIKNEKEFKDNYQYYRSDFMVDCADAKNEELDIQFIKFAQQYDGVYLSTGYADDNDYIFKVSNDFDKFENFMRSNWGSSKKKYQLSSNRGVIIDSQLLGSLSARSIINHILGLDKEDRMLEINLLNLTMRNIPFE